MRIRARSRLLAGSRGFLPITAALLPVLALTAACGGGGKGGDGSASASSDRLTRAMISAKDADHLQVVAATSKAQLLGAEQTTDPAACQPVADQWSSEPAIDRQVYTGAMVTDSAAKDKGAKTISLEVVASYPSGRAKTVLDHLAAAVAGCHSYKVTRSGRTSTFDVKAVTPTAATGGRFGDQQVSYTVADPALGASGVALVSVIRVGDSTAAFETVRADRKTAALRPAIVRKQADKLRDTMGKS
jgi:hypothetical protein